MTNTDGSAIFSFTNIVSASWAGVPEFALCKFNISAALVMAPIALAAMMEHIGDMSAISATVGGPANTTYGENAGVLELSRVHDPKVIRIAACFVILLSFVTKMAGVIGSMPSAIIGGVGFMLNVWISAIEVRNAVENHVDFAKSRNLMTASVIFVCGLGFSDGLTLTAVGTSGHTDLACDCCHRWNRTECSASGQ